MFYIAKQSYDGGTIILQTRKKRLREVRQFTQPIDARTLEIYGSADRTLPTELPPYYGNGQCVCWAETDNEVTEMELETASLSPAMGRQSRRTAWSPVSLQGCFHWVSGFTLSSELHLPRSRQLWTLDMQAKSIHSRQNLGLGTAV